MRSKLSAAAAKLNPGEVAIMLDDEEIILTPGSRTAREISRICTGLTRARIEIANENLDVMATVIRLGSGMTERDARDLADRVYESGATELVMPLIDFVVILANKGKRPNDGDRSGSRNADRAEGDGDGNI